MPNSSSTQNPPVFASTSLHFNHSSSSSTTAEEKSTTKLATSSSSSSSSLIPQHHHVDLDKNPIKSALLPDEEEEQHAPPVPWMHGLAGICGGAFSMSVFYPLDLIRTRMHTYTGKPGEKSKLRGAVESIRQDGLKVMFRGVKIAVISHSFGWGMYLTVFRTLQQSLARTNGGDSSLGDFVAACGAAGVTSAVVTPLNFLKTNIQLASGHEKVSAKIVLKRTIQKDGPFALMRGLGPQFLLSSHTTIQVALYELIKRYMWGASSIDGSTATEAPMHGVALASAASKGFASALCNPLEVMRTRLQDARNAQTIEYASMGKAFRTIWNTEGIRGLYRGVTVNVCRVVPTTVVAFITYENILKIMHRNVGPGAAKMREKQQLQKERRQLQQQQQQQ